MGNRHGLKAAIGPGEEVTWDTAVAVSVYLGVFTTGVVRAINKISSAVIPTGSSPIPSAKVCDSDQSGGTFAMPLSARAMGILWKHFFGAVSSAPATPVVGVNQHTFDTQLCETQGLTLDQYKGIDKDASPLEYLHEVFPGGILAGFRLTMNTRGEARVEWTTLTGTAQARATTTTPPTMSLLQLGSIVDKCWTVSALWQGRTYVFDTLDLTASRGHQRNDKAGSGNDGRPTAGAMSVRFGGTIDHTSDATYNDHLAEAAGDLVLTFTSKADIGATGEKRKLVFTLHDAEQVSNDGAPTTGPGLLKERVAWEPSSVTNSGFSLMVQNEDTSALAM